MKRKKKKKKGRIGDDQFRLGDAESIPCRLQVTLQNIHGLHGLNIKMRPQSGGW
jgi:hypothetical protein